MANERVQRSIEFIYGVDADDLIRGTQIAENSIEALENQVKQLEEEFKRVDRGSKEFKKLGDELKAARSQLKTLDEQFEGLGAEQKAAGIAESFNVLVGSVGAVSSAFLAFGANTEAIEEVEKKLLGVIGVVTSLREVSTGLIQAQKTLIPILGKVGNAIKAAFAANPVTLVFAAVVALTTAIVAYVRATKEAVDVGEEAIKLNESQTKEIANQTVKLRQLEFAVKDETRSEIERKLALEELKKLLPELSGVTLDQADAINKVTVAVGREIAAIKERAKLAAAQERLTKAISDNLLIEERLNAVSEGSITTIEEFNAALLLNRNAFENSNTELKKAAREYLKNNEAIEKYTQLIQGANKELVKFDVEAEAEKAQNAAEKSAEAARRVTEQAIKDLVALALPYDEFYKLLLLIPGVLESDIPDAVAAAAESYEKAAFELKNWIDRSKEFQSIGPLSFQGLLSSVTEANAEVAILIKQLDDLFTELEEPIKFFDKEQLDILRRLREDGQTELQAQLAALETQYNEEIKLFADNEEIKTQLTEEYEQNRAQLRRQYAIQTAQQLLGITSQFLSTIAEVNQQSLELQLLQAKGNEQAILAAQKESFERQKGLRRAQIIVSTAEAVVNAFTSTSQIPPPFGQIIGGILAASYIALGAKSLATVNATTFDGGGAAAGGFQNIPSGGGISIPGGGGVPVGIPGAQPGGALLPGLGGGRLGAPTIGTLEQEPVRAYVLAGDVTNGVQANIALNNRRRLAG